jgi:hypothetical protein
MSRRSFLARSSVAGAALVIPVAPRLIAPAMLRPGRCPVMFRTSLSVSPFTETVLSTLSFNDGQIRASTVKGVQRLFNRHGATEVYARIATRRYAVTPGAEMGFARGIERARLAREIGLPFNPELGLWAVYGDAEGQSAPDFSDYPSIRLRARWDLLTLAEMTNALRHYGTLVARQILATGARVNYWDLGNEVEFGVAGVAVRPLNGAAYNPPDNVDPAIGQMSAATLIGMSEDDRIAWLTLHLWPNIALLFVAIAEGIRAVDAAARFSTHISGIFEARPNLALAFWQAMSDAGYRPAQLGTSYYASSGGSGGPGDRLQWLKQTAAAIVRKFDKPMFIAEAGYPSGQMLPPFPYNTPIPGYPLSQTGQYEFIRDVVAWGASSGHLAGIRPWAPDLCTAAGHWQPMSFFVARGRTATPKLALNAISHGLAICRTHASV